VQSQLALARQSAIAQNRTVEVRFTHAPDNAGNPPAYRLLQLWMFDEKNGTPSPLGKPLFLPQGVVFETGSGVACSSTLLDTAPHEGSHLLPAFGSGLREYRAFRFRPNGGTDLDPNGPGGSNRDTWFLLLRALTDPPQSGQPPKNYSAVQLDARTGQTTVFRP
jgi:uncharacterized protein (TIGR02596 family)